MGNKKQITFGALLSYSAIAFNIISGLLYTPWMIRTIGDDQYALYTLALSVINLFLLDFGIGSAVTKFLSNYYARGQYDKANRFMGIVYKIFIAISVAIAVCLTIFYFLIDGIYANLGSGQLVVFKRLFIIVAVYSVLSFPFTTFNGVLMANERFIEVKFCNLGQKVLSVALIVLFLLTGQGVYALVLVHAFSNGFFLILKYIFIRNKTRQRTDIKSWDKGIAKNLFGYSVWITVMNLAQRCIFNIMPTVIAAFIGSAEVTLFSLASTLESYVYTFSDAINGMFMPKISKIFTEEDVEKKLTALMCKVGKFHVYTIGLIFIGFICVGKQFVGVWMGEGYELVYWSAMLLIFPSLIYVPQQVAQTALLVNNVVKQQAFIYVVMAIVNLLIAFILLSKVGVIGAAISVCIAYLIKVIGLNILYYRKLPVRLGVYFKQVYGRWIFVAIISVVSGMFIADNILLNGWIGLGVKICLIAAIYVVLIAVICIDSETRRIIVERIKHKK